MRHILDIAAALRVPPEDLLVYGGPFGSIAHGCNDVVATKAAAERADYVITEAGFGFDLGHERLPICIAKTHLQLIADDGEARRASPPVLPVEAVRVAAGAGYLLALAGDVVTMPGLARQPAAHRIDLSEDGEVTGI